jgi:hypothetical protein
MCLDSANERLVLASADLRFYDLHIPVDVGPRTHAAPICGALYAVNFGQIVTVDVTGTVVVRTKKRKLNNPNNGNCARRCRMPYLFSPDY